MGARILWAVVAGFLGGVFARSFVPLSWPFAALLFLLAAAAALTGHVRRTRALVVCAVALAAFGAGILRMDAAVLTGDPALNNRLDTTVEIEGFVIDEPDVRDGSVHLTIDMRTLRVGSTTASVAARVLVFAPLHTPIAYGDGVRIAGKLQFPEPFESGTNRLFDYPTYLGKDRIAYKISFAHVERTGERRANIAKAGALRIKQALLAGLQRALPEPEAGLAAGITLGDKRSIGGELSEVFRRASLIHIVVLSGYNITVVINAALRAFGWLPRTVRFGVGGAVVVFFILMTGGAATAMRAGLMAFLAVYARLTGRTFLALRALGVAAFLMIAWNPWTLAFDPSFQLSALATLGLITLTPLFERHFRWMPVRFSLREIACSTLATQAAVLPLLLYQSGNLSLVALPANMLALVAVPPAMGFAALAAFMGVWTGPLAPLFGFPAYSLLAYLIGVGRFFAALPFSSTTVPVFSAWLIVAAYAALFSWLLVHKREPRREAGAAEA